MWDWLGGLSDAASAIWDDIAAFLVYLINLLVALFQYLYLLLVAVFKFFYGLAQIIQGFFKVLWEDFFKKIFTALWDAAVKIHAWVESILKPVVDFIKKIRGWVDWLFKGYIKPILAALNIVRSFLKVLSALGVKWAKQLDQWIAKIETDISKAFSKVRGYLNAIIGILNALADPLGLFRKPTLVMSIRRIFPSFARGISGLPIGYFLPSPVKGLGAGWGPIGGGFSASNSALNPPPSYYAQGDDGLGSFSGFAPDVTPDDTAMDGMSALDFFNDDLYSPPDNPDPVSALADVQGAAFQKLAGQSA